MKTRVVKKNVRNKAFIGAIVGAVAGLAGSVISAKKNKKAQELSIQQQQDEQNRIDGVAQANALTSSYGNQDYVDEYKDKVVLKGGGKVKMNKGDRIANYKKMAMGGRSKAEMGSLIGEDGIGGEALGAASGLSTLASAIFSKPKPPKLIKKADGFNFGNPKVNLTPNSYTLDSNGTPVEAVNSNVVATNPNDVYTDRLSLARLGKRITKRSKSSGL